MISDRILINREMVHALNNIENSFCPYTFCYAFRDNNNDSLIEVADIKVVNDTYMISASKSDFVNLNFGTLKAAGDNIRMPNGVFRPGDSNLFSLLTTGATSCPCLVTNHYPDIVKSHFKTKKYPLAVKDLQLIGNIPAKMADQMIDHRINELEMLLLAVCPRAETFTNITPKEPIMPIMRLLIEMPLYVFSPAKVMRSSYSFMFMNEGRAMSLCLCPRTKDECIQMLVEFGMTEYAFARIDVDELVINMDDIIAHINYGVHGVILNKKLHMLTYNKLAQLLLAALYRQGKVQVID